MTRRKTMWNEREQHYLLLQNIIAKIIFFFKIKKKNKVKKGHFNIKMDSHNCEDLCLVHGHEFMRFAIKMNLFDMDTKVYYMQNWARPCCYQNGLTRHRLKGWGAAAVHSIYKMNSHSTHNTKYKKKMNLGSFTIKIGSGNFET